MDNLQFHSDLSRLIEILPPKVTKHIKDGLLDDVIELVLDLGRLPEIRHSSSKIDYLGQENIDNEDLCYIT